MTAKSASDITGIVNEITFRDWDIVVHQDEEGWPTYLQIEFYAPEWFGIEPLMLPSFEEDPLGFTNS